MAKRLSFCLVMKSSSIAGHYIKLAIAGLCIVLLSCMVTIPKFQISKLHTQIELFKNNYNGAQFSSDA